MLQQDHIYAQSSKLLHIRFIEMHHKKEVCVAMRKPIYFACQQQIWHYATFKYQQQPQCDTTTWWTQYVIADFEAATVGYKVG